MADFTSGRVTVDDASIYYEKRGTGDHVVLLLPGAMGTTTTDFLAQYKGMDLTKFTLICWDGEWSLLHYCLYVITNESINHHHNSFQHLVMVKVDHLSGIPVAIIIEEMPKQLLE